MPLCSASDLRAGSTFSCSIAPLPPFCAAIGCRLSHDSQIQASLGCWVPLPRHRELANRACRIVLVGALVLWGVVACSNTLQIALVELT